MKKFLLISIIGLSYSLTSWAGELPLMRATPGETTIKSLAIGTSMSMDSHGLGTPGKLGSCKVITNVKLSEKLVWKLSAQDLDYENDRWILSFAPANFASRGAMMRLSCPPHGKLSSIVGARFSAPGDPLNSSLPTTRLQASTPSPTKITPRFMRGPASFQ